MQNTLKDGLNLIISCIFLLYVIYDQSYVAPMGYPESIFLAKIKLRQLECKIFISLNVAPLVWLRYAGNTFNVWQGNIKNFMILIHQLNKFDKNIKISFEQE